MDDSGLIQVERQRNELEENIRRLRKSLKQWQSWEIEYEGLREEIASLPYGSNTDDVLAIARDFRAELVDDKELLTIVGGQGGSTRDQSQIVDLLAKRVDYVSLSVRNIEKQLSDAQRKRNAMLLAEEPDYREDAGLPLTNITEELDDEGNVLSSKLETPGSTAPQLVDALKKAGVKDFFEQDGIVTTSRKVNNDVEECQLEPQQEEVGATETLSSAEVTVNEGAPAREPLPERQPEEGNNLDSDLAQRQKIAKLKHNISPLEIDKPARIGDSKTTGGKFGGGNEDDTVAANHPDDTPEEAALRREMLQYGLGEVGAIVAELDLEENESDVSFDEDEASVSFNSGLDEENIDDEEESEDENGMVKHPVMSRKYLEKMKELEERHGIKAMQNLGPDTSKLPKEVQIELGSPLTAEVGGKSALAREAELKEAATPATKQREHNASKPKKKVVFAEDLDIAPETGPQCPSENVSKNRPGKFNLVEPIKDSIVERKSSTVSADTTQAIGQITARKSSKFRAAREATPQTSLSPPSPSFSSHFSQQPPKDAPESMTPPHKTHADSIFEREVTSNAKPPDADDLDVSIHRQEIAGEYYKLRNRMIQRQGGFVGGGEAENYGEEFTPLPMVDENGKEKKVSRFKAARLK